MEIKLIKYCYNEMDCFLVFYEVLQNKITMFFGLFGTV